MQQKTKKYPTFSIRVTTVSIFICSSIFVASIAIVLQYYFSQSMAQKNAVQLYDHTASNIKNYLIQQDEKAANYSTLLANFNNLSIKQKLHPEALLLLARILEKNNLYSSIYLGFANGDLQQLVNLNELQNNRDSLKVNHSDRWVLISITGKKESRIRHFSYFDKKF